MKMCKDCIHYEKRCKKYIEPTECFPEDNGCKAFRNKNKTKKYSKGVNK